MSEDPIEELFRQRSKESVSEKPRDLVWKRIETGLQNQEKKKKPLKEFVSSVWFSAAVFALIAIPYFVLFVININANQSIEIVKTDIFPNKEIKNTSDKIEVIDSKEIDDQSSSEITKNNGINKLSHKSIIENEQPQLENKNELNIKENLETEIASLQTKVLDSIEKNDQLALNSKLRKFSSHDSITAKPSPPIVIRGYNRIREDKDLLSQKQSNQTTSLTNSEVVSGLAMSADKKIESKEDNITYKLSKFIVKTDILRTSFRLDKRSNTKIVFVNKTIIISFEKVNDKIIFRSNEPKMDPNLIKLLETNKKDIFIYYQKK